MSENSVQISVKVDLKELPVSLQSGKSAVKEQTDDMAAQFKKLAKESKEAIDGMEKAAQMAGIQISDGLKSTLEEVPKLASAIEGVFAGGGVLAFLKVLFEVGKILKGLYDEFIALKGAQEAWDEAAKNHAAAQEAIQAKMRQNAIEHIRLTQGQAAAMAASIKMADQELIPIGKDIEQLLSSKKASEFSDGLKKSLAGLQHFNFGELPQKSKELGEAIERARKSTEDLKKKAEELAYMKWDPAGHWIYASYVAGAQKGQAELQILLDKQKEVDGWLQTHGDNVKDREIAEKQQKAAEYRQWQQKQLQDLKSGLQDQKDTLDAFHTLSRQAEVKYWDDVLAKHKVKGSNLKEVERLRNDAQKDADRQALASEVEAVQQQVDAAKAGSQRRVEILDDELRKMRTKHQEETAEYKRLSKERERAQEESERKSLRDEVEAIHDHVAETKAGSRERIQILDDEIKKLERESKTDTEEYKRLVKERAQAWREFYKDQDDVEQEHRKGEQQHAEALKSLELSRLDFQRQIGKLGETDYEQRMRSEIEATYRKELRVLEIERSKYQSSTKEYEKAQAAIVKLTDKRDAEIEKLEQKSYLRRRQQFDQYFKQISSSFNSALNSWMQGTETATQAFTKMFQGILQQLVDFVEQWIEHKIEMWLMDEVLGKSARNSQARDHIQADVAEIQADANLAAATAYAEWAAYPLLAEGMAALAYGSVMKYAAAATAGAAKFEVGGVVPATGLALVHQGERILPASMSGQGLPAGGTITVVVNHSVNAVDAESFQGVIRRHGNIIGNEVARVLKKRGLAAK